ncbi:LOW QUALITY PROTEIN: hypothetical protein SETIT_9G237300v2 [Setaria italica]|uniref:Uncharacterized protein n=2 Tax=Setaria italica TaxID=4555 RepID=A0A368SK32_SETIT|nr:LOW QUALITY PROTEIN: hypothetical protein SETIT_9G237300v2 [Setaria italica]
MPHRKIQMGLIGKLGSCTRTFKKARLQKKAFELVELCDVGVAIVVCAGPSGSAPDVWEFGSAGVVDRYRRLPADRRVKHTHLGYLSAELGKEKARLAREWQEGPKVLLDGVDLEELLESIDAALLATAQRRKALGMPDDDGGQLRQAAPDAGVPLVGDGFDDHMEAWVDELTWHGVVESHPLNASMMQQLAVHQQRRATSVECWHDAACIQRLQYLQQMGGNGDNDHGQQHNTLLCPDYGFQYTDSNDYSYSDMNGCPQMLMPSNANAYDGCWFNQAMYPSLDITCNPMHMPPEHSTMGTTGHCFTGILAIGLDDGSFIDAGGYKYGTLCLADYFQCPDDSQQLGVEPLHYLSDVAEGGHASIQV